VNNRQLGYSNNTSKKYITVYDWRLRYGSPNIKNSIQSIIVPKKNTKSSNFLSNPIKIWCSSIIRSSSMRRLSSRHLKRMLSWKTSSSKSQITNNNPSKLIIMALISHQYYTIIVATILVIIIIMMIIVIIIIMIGIGIFRIISR